MDVVDEEDPAQDCAVQYITADGKEWVNDVSKGYVNGTLMGLAVAVGLLTLW